MLVPERRRLNVSPEESGDQVKQEKPDADRSIGHEGIHGDDLAPLLLWFIHVIRVTSAKSALASGLVVWRSGLQLALFSVIRCARPALDLLLRLCVRVCTSPAAPLLPGARRWR